MSAWTQRPDVPSGASAYWSTIWDGPGWQVNLSSKDGDNEAPYFLIDAVMPMGIPASAVVGRYSSLAEAQSSAEAFGPPDWSGFDPE